MLRMIAIIFGIAFIFVGVAGFMPERFMTNDLLFGYFEVNSMHNMVHIATGVIAIMAATALRYTILFFKIFGIVYLAVAIWGFWSGGDLYMMHVNMADNVLHLVVALVSLYLGFLAYKAKRI